MNEKKINRRCTQVRAGDHVVLAGGIVVKNAGQHRINLVIETPAHLNQSQSKEIISNEPTKKLA